MAKKKQVWGIGAVFLIKIQDESFVIGQIVGREAHVLNSVSIAIFDERTDGRAGVESLKLLKESIFSVVFTTRDLLDSGIWKVVGNAPVGLSQNSLPHESLRSLGFVGAKIYGSGNVNALAGAFYGHKPWDAYKDPNYLDDLLISSDKKPAKLMFKDKTN